MGGAFGGKINNVTDLIICSGSGAIVSSCSEEERSESVLKLRVAITFLGSIRINAKNLVGATGN